VPLELPPLRSGRPRVIDDFPELTVYRLDVEDFAVILAVVGDDTNPP
jgi:hypothetical protein